MKPVLYAICISLLFASSLQAQNPRKYELKTSLEIPALLLGLGTTGLGYVLENRITPLSETAIMALDVQDVPRFDRFATKYWSTTVSNTSDYLLTAGMVLPLGLAVSARCRKEGGPIALMYVEAFLLNEGMTNITKTLVKRKRPFVYNPEVSLGRKMGSSAQKSYFSGHTSTAAVASFFFAKVFADLYPNSPHKRWVWVASASLPAVVGFLRVRSGRHYLSDVVSGYAVGALTGVLIPHLHKKNIPNLSIHPGFNSMGMTLSF